MSKEICSEKILELEKNVSYIFNNKSLLLEALTHSSYSHEHNLDYNYERLEFLGDAVVELIVSEYIVNNYEDYDEGVMSKIRAYVVNEGFLSNIARQTGISSCILLGKGEAAASAEGNDSILADILEAFIAAVYLDSGYDKARDFLLPLIKIGVEDAANGRTYIDEKGDLQKLSQKYYKVLPEYNVIEEVGPDHNKIFTVSLHIGNTIHVIGKGRSKKLAEKEAAKVALSKIIRK